MSTSPCDQSDLKNGVRVVTRRMPQRDSVSIGILIGVGGRHEDDALKGAAHFLEHILFKGSRHYSCQAIKREIEGVGGSLNAFTAEEQTCYYAKVPSKHLSKTLAILSDMVTAPAIPGREVLRERTVIQEEIKMYHDLPQYHVLDMLDGMVWPGHPLGRALIGTHDSVGGMTRAALSGFHRRHYVPRQIVVSAAGHVNHAAFVRQVRQKFVEPNEQSLSTTPAFSASGDSRPGLTTAKRPIQQMHVALGMAGLNRNDPRRYALHLMNIILGGNMSSRLFDVIREKHGLAYSISSGLKMFQDTGMFMVRAGLDPAKAVAAVELCARELERIRRTPVRDDELRRAKDFYAGQFLLGLEDSMDHMLWIGEATLLRGRPRPLSAIMRDIRNVTPQAVREAARTVLVPGSYQLAAAGPVTPEHERRWGKVLGTSGK